MVISRVMGEIFLSFFFFLLLRFNKINQYSFHAMVCDGIPQMVILTSRKRNFITAIKLAPCVLFWIIIKKKKKEERKEKNILCSFARIYRWTGENQLVANEWFSTPLRDGDKNRQIYRPAHVGADSNFLQRRKNHGNEDDCGKKKVAWSRAKLCSSGTG